MLVTFFSNISAQIDSANVNVLKDSSYKTIVDSVEIADTNSIKDTSNKKTDIDAVVYAAASDSLRFNVQDKKMYIYGKGELKYKKVDLKSGEIKINFNTNDLEAKGIVDTADTSSRGFVQTPELSEAGEMYEGMELKYNFKTKRGFIEYAENKKEGSSYRGTKVKKVSEDTYFVKNGIYTTCDAENPHTHFAAKEMKVIRNKQIVAKWVLMYIAGVPIPIPLPFGVFPTKTGRRSGILPPGYGVSQRRGQSFTDFGYYWAMNDYMDLALTADYYSKTGWAFRSDFNYKKRYSYNGSIRAGYAFNEYNEYGDADYSKSNQWNLKVNHSQEITPSSRLNVNLSFQSGDYYRQISTRYDNLLRQEIVSNATYSKRWEDWGGSMTINYNRSQDLQDGDIREILPNISFNKSQFYPFRNENVTSKSDQKWYELIGVSYNSRFQNKRNKINGDLNIRGGFQHNVSVNASPKVGFFNISPNISYREKWYNKRITKEIVQITKYDSSGKAYTKDTLATRDKKELNFVRTFDLGVSASTKLYGILQANKLGIEAFRHTITPSISYTYSPDFSDDSWDYYDSYIDADGVERRYDKFQREIFSGVPSSERQAISFSVGNNFEMKTLKDPTDTTSQAKKIQLMNVSLNTAYDFTRDSLKLSDLRIGYRTKIGDLLNLSGNTTYSFYQYNSRGLKIDKYMIDKGKIVRLTNLRLSVSTNLSGDKIKGEDRQGESQEDDDYNAFSESQYESIYEEVEPDYSIPWNISLSYTYNMNKSNPFNKIIRSNINLNLGFNLTKNWKFRVSGHYDFREQEFSAPSITINRDLHCWQMNFDWKPLGIYRGFRFEIRMKAPELRDIKVTKSGGLYTGIR